MTRWTLGLLLVGALPCAALLPIDSHPGRFASLDAGQPVRQAVNGTYSLDLEKVLKLHALVPRRDGDSWGTRVYAGSLSVCAPDGTWGHALPETQRRQHLRWHDQDRVSAGLSYTAPDWSAEAWAAMTTDDPRVRFTVTRTSGTAPLTAGLLGYSWAERKAPFVWSVDGQSGFPIDRRPQVFRAPRRLVTLDLAGFRMVLSFSSPPEEVRIDADGLTWQHAPGVDSYELAYLVLPGDLDSDLAVMFQTAARRTCLGLGSDGRDCWAELRGEGPGWIMVPPALAPLAPAVGSAAQGVTGALWCQPGSQRITLPTPPGLHRILPTWPTLSAEPAAYLARQTEAVLSRQRPDGTFPFNEGRAFHEGTTLAVLCEVAPLLPAELQARVRAAVESGLRYQWSHLTPIGERPWDVMPPEQPGFTGAGIDYPEILACLLQATLLHSRRWQVDPIADQGTVARQARQLTAYMDRSGIALANPGPTFHHLIAESAIGGYLAWQALAHLSWGGQPAPWRREALGRAAYAWQAWRTLFASRTAFGEPGIVVNGIERGCLELGRREPWVFVQSTWFTHLPCFELPTEDLFGIWRALDEQPWQEWTGRLGSTQRAYDAANAIALTRVGRGAEVKRLWPAIQARPYVWDSFDQTPVLELAALGWLGTSP